MRTTLANAKASRIAENLNILSTDARFVKYLNEATERLLYRGKWWGTMLRYNVSVTSQLLSLPPQIDTAEAIAVDNVVLPLRDECYEFLDNGWGPRDETLNNGINEAMLRGTYPTFKSLSASSIVTLKCDVALDVAKTVRILGYDSNGNWVRTLVGGVWVDGESVALDQGAGTASATTWSSITDIQPSSGLSGQWWLYQGTVAAGTMIGHYQYWETAPRYKRYLVPFLDASTSSAVILGKAAFVPVAVDTDYLIIGNLAALKLACRAIKAEEESNWVEANLLWNGGSDGQGGMRIGALTELEMELRHHLGDGRRVGLNLSGSSVGACDPVEALV